MKRQWSLALSLLHQHKKKNHTTCVLTGESEETTEQHCKISGDKNSPNCYKLEARLGWNLRLTSLLLLHKEHMKDNGPQWANNPVHRRVNIGMGTTEKTCNSKMEGSVITFPSFSDIATGINYPSVNPCHKELVCYLTNQMPIHLLCMIGNKFTIFISNFL